MKPLFIGQAPARSMLPGCPAFVGSDSKIRLEKLLGIDDMLDHFDTLNLIREFPGRTEDGKHDEFDLIKAAEGAKRIKDWLPVSGHRKILLAGRQVARAWGMPKDIPWFSWTKQAAIDPFAPAPVDLGTALGYIYVVAIVPHPGGTTLWWNEEANRERARRWYVELLGLKPATT